MCSKQQVAATLDHAVLKPYNTDEDIIRNARMCVQYGVAKLTRYGRATPAVRELRGMRGQGVGRCRLSARCRPPGDQGPGGPPGS